MAEKTRSASVEDLLDVIRERPRSRPSCPSVLSLGLTVDLIVKPDQIRDDGLQYARLAGAKLTVFLVQPVDDRFSVR